MEAKAFEIRDSATFIPVIAVRMMSSHPKEHYLLRRSGYGSEPLVMLCRMGADGSSLQASYSPFNWGNARTLICAHQHIEANWDKLTTGDVIDIQFILGETPQPKLSEAQTVL